jgi:DNA polymerase-3 subunit alpha
MRSPNGDITTQFDLHRSERLGDTKFDFLSTELTDKIIVTLKLLQEEGYFDKNATIREIYNKVLHPENINLKDERIWKGLELGNVLDVFQFNTQIGKETAREIKPKNPIEMTAANALLRLTAPNGQERPLTRYLLFKDDIKLWYKEMTEAGLSEEEQKWLEPYYLSDYGVPSSQEALMRCMMDEHLTHFSLSEANKIRKTLAKKIIKEIPTWEKKIKEQSPSPALGAYIWNTMALPQLSYSFSINHAMAYSFIGIQTLILATNYPEVYWNTACLIVNSQSLSEDFEEEEEELTTINEDIEEEDEEEDSQKKNKTSDYGRIILEL